MDDEHTKDDLDPGAFIGHEPELAAETIPGGVQPDDERVAGYATQSSGVGAEEDRVQGRPDDWPQGHRHAEPPGGEDDAVRGAGQRG
ncbi:MAG: hypothetical protein M3295_10490 [Chloroflexota bacterium]|nr:hypothetical protein [Chloroflexota bacterium]